MKTKILISVVLVLTLVLAACAPKAAAPTKQARAASAVPPASQATAVPTQSTNTTSTAPTANAKPTPTQEAAATEAPSTSSEFATPTVGPALINDIAVHDQAVTSGSVLISLVDSLKPGWVAVFTDNNGQPGTILGYTAIPEGTSSDVKVNIDTGKATNKMIAMLLTDAGKMGTFEYPDVDQPVKNADINTNVMATFNKLSSGS